jgi:hypothetical protein
VCAADDVGAHAGGYVQVAWARCCVLRRMQQEAEDQLADAEPEALAG